VRRHLRTASQLGYLLKPRLRLRRVKWPPLCPLCVCADLMPSGDKTFFDIGCNKGYTSSKFFGLWAPEVGFNPKAINAKRPEVWCGNW
jgi:hypothetical protein